MVRVGGMNYSCNPKATMGKRIGDMTLNRNGQTLDPNQTYVVAGWASINEDVEGPPIYDLMETYISRKKVIDLPAKQAVKVIGMG
jgi:sulfur-oxidizing protein SoxB